MSVDGLHTRSTMLGLNMYAKAENGQLSRAASLSMREAGLISLKGKKWRDANGIADRVFVPGRGSNRDDATGREVIGGDGADRRAAQREMEEAVRARSARRRADGRMELNVLASLLGRAVRQTEGKDGDDGSSSGEVMEAFKLNLSRRTRLRLQRQTAPRWKRTVSPLWVDQRCQTGSA